MQPILSKIAHFRAFHALDLQEILLIFLEM